MIETTIYAAIAAFFIALVSATGGITGAFLLLPVQIGILGIASPSVSATNHLYNIFAAPGGVYRYWKEGRLSGPLVGLVTGGTLPGIIIGVLIRIYWLSNAEPFKVFAGIVLLVLGLVLLRRTWSSASTTVSSANVCLTESDLITMTWTELRIRYQDNDYSVKVIWLVFVSFLIGVIGGAYGIGGGVFTSAYLVGICGLPVYMTAGATLFATFFSSVLATIIFAVLPLFGIGVANEVTPVWSLGIAMGLAGYAGGYLGARLQKRLPSKLILTVLAILMLGVAGKYVAVLF